MDPIKIGAFVAGFAFVFGSALAGFVLALRREDRTQTKNRAIADRATR